MSHDSARLCGGAFHIYNGGYDIAAWQINICCRQILYAIIDDECTWSPNKYLYSASDASGITSKEIKNKHICGIGIVLLIHDLGVLGGREGGEDSVCAFLWHARWNLWCLCAVFADDVCADIKRTRGCRMDAGRGISTNTVQIVMLSRHAQYR